jgi:hypothetical protein
MVDASRMDADLIDRCKHAINEDNFGYFQEQVHTAIQSGETYDWPYVFHRVYLHACLKGRAEIADWMRTSLFMLMDPIMQIGIRQIFSYGRVLLAKAASRALNPPHE